MLVRNWLVRRCFAIAILVLGGTTVPRAARSQRPWVVSQTPVLTLGEGPSKDDQFGRLREALRLPSGEFLVVDGSANELRVFSATGSFVRRIGGTGRGPSEFQRVSGVVVDGDSLRIFDNNLRKIASFDLQGRFGSTTLVQSTGDARFPLNLYRLAGFVAGGALLVPYAAPANMRPVSEQIWDSVPTVLYNREGRDPRRVGEYFGIDIYATPTRAGSVVFARVSSAAFADGVLYMTDGGAYSIRRYALPSNTVTKVEQSRPVRPVTNADVVALPAILRERHRAATKPWISQLVIDALGNLWVEDHAGFSAAPRDWTVFDRDGKRVAGVTTPVGLRVTYVGRDLIVGVATNADDVEVVRVYRLAR